MSKNTMLEVFRCYKFNKSGEAIVKVIVENEACEYTIDNLKDIFGRCEGEQVDFGRIEKVFDVLWTGWRAYSFDEVSRLMYLEV